ncbi:L-aspartate dehydrogenase [compost metagenome]|uniref:L-aspartate dehydrogenase n=1 Tax=Variovorax boronicumulans TaxID=436515 RepID=A0A250DK70_9BURK|nr:aspartate dehydrogenase [Variovorax boronicumulans]ATA54343.1 aspartate dehydrogenase [Variovorax boronicumulans]MDP9878345.1 aspartate dehydrogenase [Variovorax boronicumulans]MDP9916156.1 aspartate dehydrogenase [Variovorax boronicumulans]MDP9923651.1 aspartate dehydrogenase [Variovorax boronicumulans]PBI94059.1 L-aspartate dehydrogenase [Variovorax boronicumulans]
MTTAITRIALVGCGAIGTSVLELLRGDPALKVVAIVVPAEGIAAAQKVAPDAQVGSAVPADGIDLVVETAGHAAIEEHVLPALARGTPCVVASVGALSATGFAEKLEAAAVAGRTQVQLIPGAIGGIDALAAARIGGLDSVRYTGRKPPQAWKGTPAEQGRNLDTLAHETVIFEGSAREAALLYPKNANVAATVSLAGLGLDQTLVRLIADPATTENVHTVEAEGAFGSFALTMRNKPLAANPKTSALTVYSAVRALRNRVAALAI